jgi:hypothetical protein
MILPMKGEVRTNLYNVRARLVNTSVLKPQRVSKMLIWILAIPLRFLTISRTEGVEGLPMKMGPSSSWATSSVGILSRI